MRVIEKTYLRAGGGDLKLSIKKKKNTRIDKILSRNIISNVIIFKKIYIYIWSTSIEFDLTFRILQDTE